MNYDRLLTRVWDKQEKKMLYPNLYNYIGTLHSKQLGTIYHAKFIGMHGKDMLILFCNFNEKSESLQSGIVDITQITRFIPMQCTGFRPDDENPTFEHDIIKTHMGEKALILLSDGCWIAELSDGSSVDLASLEGCFTVIGNQWRIPELLEESK